jgi:hypothetical protein
LTEQIPEDLKKAGYAVSPFAVAAIIVGFAIVAGEGMAQLPGGTPQSPEGTPQAVDTNPLNPDDDFVAIPQIKFRVAI